MSTDRYIFALKKNLPLLIGIVLFYVFLIILAITTDARVRKALVVDIVFVFDTTGSMQEQIDGLLEISTEFAKKLDDSGIDFRIGMVDFGALGEPELIRDVFPLSNDVSAFKNFLQNTHAYGGALGHEDQPTAIKYAINEMNYRPQADKFLILLTDEEVLGGAITLFPDDDVITDWENIIKTLKKRDFTVYSVTIPIKPYLEIASETGGKFYDIRREEDFTDIILEIVDEINILLTK